MTDITPEPVVEKEGTKNESGSSLLFGMGKKLIALKTALNKEADIDAENQGPINKHKNNQSIWIQDEMVCSKQGASSKASQKMNKQKRRAFGSSRSQRSSQVSACR